MPAPVVVALLAPEGAELSRAPGHPVTSYVLCADPASRLLIVQAAGSGAWQLPGGVVEAGESPLDAVLREGARDRLVFLWAGPDDACRLLHPAVAARIRSPLRWPGSVTCQETRTERTDRHDDGRVPRQDAAHRHP
ncbi:NUDIX domain-containing protein [Kitasatospora sp. NPDC088391]|uniref:NUDIX domain-containing protein n=1 Tax=Kitasatospora sp. NPDC088391 TaxID=3364074 RepID=UPI003818F3E4